MKKKTVLGVIVSCVTLLLLVSCGRDSEPNGVGSPVGEQIGQIYSNERFMIQCSLPDDWTAVDAETRLSMMGIVSDAVNSEDFEALVEKSGTWYELYAFSPDDSMRITITEEKARAFNRLIYTEKDLLDGSVTTLEQTLAGMGLKNVISERGVKNFAGSEREYLSVSGEGTDTAMYLEVFYIKSYSYYACITLASKDADRIEEIEGFFTGDSLASIFQSA